MYCQRVMSLCHYVTYYPLILGDKRESEWLVHTDALKVLLYLRCCNLFRIYIRYISIYPLLYIIKFIKFILLGKC